MKQKIFFTLLALAVAISTIAVMHDQESKQNELRQEAFRSMEALNSPDISGREALECEANIYEAVDARAVFWNELEYSSCTVGELVKFAQQRDVRETALSCMNQLRNNDNLSCSQEIECARTIDSAVQAGVVSYEDLGVEDELSFVNWILEITDKNNFEKTEKISRGGAVRANPSLAFFQTHNRCGFGKENNGFSRCFLVI